MPFRNPHSRPIRKLWLAAALTASALVIAPAAAGAHGKPDKGAPVSVMTRNLYLGADLAPAINATSTNGFIDANGQIIRDVITNNFNVRAKGLASEIISKSPDLVGLQEVAEWRSGPLNDAAPFTCTGTEDDTPPFGCKFTASTVRYDYLKQLMDQLNKGKQRYRVVQSNQEFDFEAPTDANGVPGDGDAPGLNDNGEENDRLTMRDVILAKVGKRVKTTNVQTGHYRTLYSPSVAGAVTVHVVRGWLSTDNPLGCCLNTSILTANRGSVKDFDHQVDHVLTDRPKQVGLVSSAVTGRKPVHGFWDSDHAGLFSALTISG